MIQTTIPYNPLRYDVNIIHGRHGYDVCSRRVNTGNSMSEVY